MMKKKLHDDYQFQFDKLLHNETTRAVMKRYMKEERNVEAMEFWEKYQELITYYTNRSREDLITIVNHIYVQFFTTSSKYEVNVSAKTKREVTLAKDEFVQNELLLFADAVQIFQIANTSLLNSMERDVFVRFVRSQMWIKFVSKNYKSESDLDQIAIHKSQLKQMYLSSEDEERPYCTLRDVLMGFNLRRDGIDWKLFYTKKFNMKYTQSVMMFNTRLTFIDEECEQKHGDLRTIKIVTRVNCSAQTLIKVLFSKQKHKYIFNLKDGDGYQVTSVHVDNNNEVNQLDIKLNGTATIHFPNLGIPFASPRETFFSHTTCYIPQNEAYFEIMKPMPKDLIYDKFPDATSSNNHVLMRTYSWNILENMGDNQCEYCQVLGVGMGGMLQKDSKLGRWALKNSSKKIFSQTAMKIDDALCWYFENGEPDVGDEFKRFELIDRNMPITQNVSF
jgi:hypothetical protein